MLVKSNHSDMESIASLLNVRPRDELAKRQVTRDCLRDDDESVDTLLTNNYIYVYLAPAAVLDFVLHSIAPIQSEMLT